MYFFLSNFSFLEICYVSVTLSRISINLQSEYIHIYFFACTAKIYFISVLGNTEYLVSTVIYRDCYVAKCSFLQLPLIINQGLCIQLMMLGSWISGVTARISKHARFSLCHFFGSNYKLGCGHVFLNEMSVSIVVPLVNHLSWPLFIGYLAPTVKSPPHPMLPSAMKWVKIFSTCSVHITRVHWIVSVVSDSATLWMGAHQAPCPRDSPGKNAGMGCWALLQGLSPTQGLNLPLFCLQHWQVGSLPLAPPGKPHSWAFILWTQNHYILMTWFQTFLQERFFSPFYTTSPWCLIPWHILWGIRLSWQPWENDCRNV